MVLTVLSVAYPLATVSEDAVGGAEQVLAMLDRSLVEAGHRSLVIAPAGSRVSGTLIALPPVADPIDDAARARMHGRTREAIARTLAAEAVDVVHFHGIDFADYFPQAGDPSPKAEIPTIVTLHLPLAWYAPESFAARRPNTYFQCVSESQRCSAPLAGVELLPAISNGVDLSHFHLRARKQNFALMLGRICPEKGTAIALRVCHRAGVPLLIGGHVHPYPAHRTYFEKEAAPLLDGCRRFLGPLALERKAALLASARCLLIPSVAAETSSLVAMEALASGTPVVAFRSSALLEIIDNGRTGFLVDDETQMGEAMARAGEIDSAACRAAAEDRFSAARTIERYFALYRKVSGQ